MSTILRACRSDEEQVESDIEDGDFLEETREFVSSLEGDALEDLCKHIHYLLGKGEYIGEAFEEKAKAHKESLVPLAIAKHAA